MGESSREIEKMLKKMDFSRRRRQAVWRKVLLRLETAEQELSLSDLDHISAGLSEPPKKNEDDKPEKK